MHGKTVEIRTRIGLSACNIDRVDKIPRLSFATVRKLIREAYLEGFIEGRTDTVPDLGSKPTTQREAWSESGVKDTLKQIEAFLKKDKDFLRQLEHAKGLA